MSYYLIKRVKVFLIYIKTFREIPIGRNKHKLSWQMQKLKINKHKPLDYILCDKYLVRDFIKLKLGNEFLIPLLGAYDSIKQINFDSLDYPVVIKNSHSSGGVLILREQSDIDHDKLMILEKCLNKNYFKISNEEQYKHIKPRIIIEKCILKENKLPDDFKFHCFNGEVLFVYCSIDREGSNYRKVYNKFWEPIELTWSRKNQESKFDGKHIEKPNNLHKMIKVAEYLANRSKYCRIDLYSIDNNIYFGEYTHYHGGGLEFIKPEKYNHLFGACLLD